VDRGSILHGAAPTLLGLFSVRGCAVKALIGLSQCCLYGAPALEQVYEQGEQTSDRKHAQGFEPHFGPVNPATSRLHRQPKSQFADAHGLLDGNLC
jgi:hypothetical protein